MPGKSPAYETMDFISGKTRETDLMNTIRLRSSFIKLLLVILLVVGLGTPSFLAQAITGRLVGTVQDASQAVVPDAKVTITNQATGSSWEVQTDGQGNYVAPSLPSGNYKVSVSAAGFRNAVAGNVPR